MKPCWDRRMTIWLILMERRQETMQNLAHELHVCSRTIQNDIVALSLYFPIVTERGRYGCVKIMDRPRACEYSVK